MKIAIFGIQGQLGRDLELELSDWGVIGMRYEDVNVTDADAVHEAVTAAGARLVHIASELEIVV